MLNKFIKLFSIILVTGYWSLVTAAAELRIDIIAGNVQPIPIAIQRFEFPAGHAAEARQIREIIERNLSSTGLFRVIPVEAHPRRVGIDEMPNFENWDAIRAQVMVKSQLSLDGPGQYRLRFAVWDITGREQIEAQILTASRASLRRLAHIASDAIYERLTGGIGHFDTQIVFISESGPMDDRTTRMAIMDQDGHNKRYLSSGEDRVFSPHFAPNMQTIVFISFRDGAPTVWTLDLNTGAQRRLGRFEDAMTFAPRFSPCGTRVAMTMARGGTTNIYEYNMETRALRRLTTGNAVNTSPSYSPCGRYLAFNSNRSGSQQIHVLTFETMTERRITFGTGRYATPAWSPDGNFIAFTKIERGTFQIGVMDPRGRGERILASGWFMESPSWAPGSRRVVYFTTDRVEGDDTLRVSRIRSVDIMGMNDYEITLPGGRSGSDPSWSPRLP